MEGRTATTGSSRCDAATFNCTAGCHEFFHNNWEELLWLATTIIGNAAEAEECVADSMRHSDLASHIAPNWIGPWIKRSVAKIAISRTSAEMQRVAAGCTGPSGLEIPDRYLRDSNYPNLRSIPVENITGRIDAFERAALILHVYLGFSIPDCALLMGCQRSLVAPVCAGALEKIIDRASAISAQHTIHDDRRSAEEAA